MKPPFPLLARTLAGRLRDETMPELTGFGASNVAMTAAVLDMAGELWDGAAARLVEENGAFGALLERGGAAQPSPDRDLRISALEAENERLRAALIELQTAIEARDDADARTLDAAIWAELARSVERRRIAAANF